MKSIAQKIWGAAEIERKTVYRTGQDGVKDNIWAPEIFRIGEKLYYVCSAYLNIGYQCIYIAEMENPYTLKSGQKGAMISEPEHNWEKEVGGLTKDLRHFTRVTVLI